MRSFSSLFILAFDHRTSFAKKMFGVTGEPSVDQMKEIQDFKYCIYEGYEEALQQQVVGKDAAALLIDEQYGERVLVDARKKGYTYCLAVEKSGQDEFDFEYGDAFREHITRYNPSLVKVLIRYNPGADAVMNERQRKKLKVLSDFCHEAGYPLLIEPLIPATDEQMASVSGNEHRYDNEVRPALMVDMIKEMQDEGIEPLIWKIEGLEQTAQYEKVITQAKSGGRDQVGAVILGRGADAGQVERWLKAASQATGIIGFAIGRTIFWQPLNDLKKGMITRDEAKKQITQNYLHFYRVFTDQST